MRSARADVLADMLGEIATRLEQAPRGAAVTAPVGAIVRLYVDLRALVAIDDIQTQSGRRYQVIAARTQERAAHARVVRDTGGRDRRGWSAVVTGVGDRT